MEKTSSHCAPFQYVTSIGTVHGSGQVHIVHGRKERQRVVCRFGAHPVAITSTLAECPDGTDICEILAVTKVQQARLCRRCFSVKTRERYRHHFQDAGGTLRGDDGQAGSTGQAGDAEDAIRTATAGSR